MCFEEQFLRRTDGGQTLDRRVAGRWLVPAPNSRVIIFPWPSYQTTILEYDSRCNNGTKMKDSPPPALTPDKGDGEGSAMVPQEMAIQLLQSKDARIAAAAARVFSPRSKGGSPILAAAVAAVESQPSPTGLLPPPASESADEDSMRSAKRKTSESSSPTAFATKDTDDTNDDSSATAASALLKAMASATTSAAAGTAAAAPSAPRTPGKKFSSTERLQRR